LQDLIGRRTVSCAERDIDRYGRLVAQCQQGDIDIGEWLVSQGLALAYRRYSEAYIPAEQAASAAQRGVWGRLVHGSLGLAPGARLVRARGGLDAAGRSEIAGINPARGWA
jgi:endonuclease YncB( thermonuclease family)